MKSPVGRTMDSILREEKKESAVTATRAWFTRALCKVAKDELNKEEQISLIDKVTIVSQPLTGLDLLAGRLSKTLIAEALEALTVFRVNNPRGIWFLSTTLAAGSCVTIRIDNGDNVYNAWPVEKTRKDALWTMLQQ